MGREKDTTMTRRLPLPNCPNPLVEQNLDLVDPIARRIAKTLPACFEVQDLQQAGRLGLLDAAAKFDRHRGVPFRAYAQKRILGEIYSSIQGRTYRDATCSSLDGCECPDERVNKPQL